MNVCAKCMVFDAWKHHRVVRQPENFVIASNKTIPNYITEDHVGFMPLWYVDFHSFRTFLVSA